MWDPTIILYQLLPCTHEQSQSRARGQGGWTPMAGRAAQGWSPGLAVPAPGQAAPPAPLARGSRTVQGKRATGGGRPAPRRCSRWGGRRATALGRCSPPREQRPPATLEEVTPTPARADASPVAKRELLAAPAKERPVADVPPRWGGAAGGPPPGRVRRRGTDRRTGRGARVKSQAKKKHEKK